MTKTLKLSVGIALGLLVGYLVMINSAYATVTPEVEQCGNQTTKEKTSDYKDSKVEIDFINTAAAGNPDSVKVEAQTGYKIVKVLLKVDSDDQADYYDYTSSFPGTFNPNPGEKIHYAKVTVEKTCTPVCLDPAANNTGELIEGQTIVDPTVCTFDPEPETPATPPATIAEAPAQLPMTGAPLLALVGMGVVGTAFGISLREAKRFFKKD